MIGKTISHYKIIEKLGEGGMGVVYKALDTKLDRFVALKFLPPDLDAGDLERARFVQEAKAASAINHPNVCVIHDIKEHDGRQFIVMEYVEGETLRKKLQKESLDIKKTVEYALQIAEALDAAHRGGIVHRDIKSDNIMITAADRIKVMDFGLAKLKGSVRLTKTSSTLGTLAYMSPEQIQGKDIDTRSDIFSFGVLFYEMLTGHLPFHGDYESALMYAILNEEPEPVQKYRPGLSSEFLHVLDRSLEKDTENRYQTAKDMLIDLKRLKRGIEKAPYAVRPEKPKASSDGAASQSGAGEAATAPGRKASVRARIVWSTVGIAAVIVIVFVLYGKLGRKEPMLRFDNLRITPITSNGNVRDAVISPDGKYVVYVKTDGGLESLYLRQIATDSDVRILPPGEASFVGLSFSKDGEYIYYVLRRREEAGGVLHCIPVLGGASSRILEGVDGQVTFSPDGERFAFVRGTWMDKETTLYTADRDGGNVTRLAGMTDPEVLFADGPAWSPNGKKILCSSYMSAPGKFPAAIVEISEVDGSVKEAISKRYGGIMNPVWNGSGRGLFMIAADMSSIMRYQVRYVSYPGGDERMITNDLNHYTGLSATADGTSLVTVQRSCLSNIWVVDGTGTGAARKVTSGRYDGVWGIAWAPGGRIIHVNMDRKVWSMNGDGADQHLLTLSEFNNLHASVTPDGRYIVTSSYRSMDAMSLWRMDGDGSNPIRLTTGIDDRFPHCSTDGRWVVYRSLGKGKPSAQRVSIEGGESVSLTDKTTYAPAFSPDGTMIACFYRDDESPGAETVVAVLPFDGGEPLMQFDSPADAGVEQYSFIRWTPDGRAVTYIVHSDGASNIWRQPLDGSPPAPITNFGEQRIFAFDISMESGRIACARGRMDSDAVLISNIE
jgi:Tol biopolymer transport system component/predicted Ser/Thr protein kinase